MEVQLRADQWAAEPPECPRCTQGLHQEFSPPAIGGSHLARAHRVAEDILEKDYGVADLRQAKGATIPQVRYADASPQPSSSWGAAAGAIEQAISLGRQSRIQHGSGLDVLQTSLKNGTQPDLIKLSKMRSARIW